MIKLSLSKDISGRYVAFQAQGHAAYAEPGQDDIVCAAVTALAVSLINSLIELLQIKNLEYIIDEANISCSMLSVYPNLTKRQIEDADLLFNSFELACRQISLSYGEKYLKVEVFKTDFGNKNR